MSDQKRLRPLTAHERETLRDSTGYYHQQLITTDNPAREFLEKRKLWVREVVEGMRLGYVSKPCTGDEKFLGMMSMPMLCLAGHATSVRYRNLSAENDRARFLQVKGSRTGLYNLPAFHSASGYILVAEGNSDTMALAACGLPAIGVQGANSFKPYQARLFAGFDKVIVVRDNDEAGEKLVEAFREVDGVIGTVPPEGKDVCDFYTAQGKEAVLEWLDPLIRPTPATI